MGVSVDRRAQDQSPVSRRRQGPLVLQVKRAKGGLTLGGEHSIQHTGDVLENCTFETYTIL